MKWWLAQPTTWYFAHPPPAAPAAWVGAATQVAPPTPAGRNLRAEVSPPWRSTPNTAEDRRAYGPKNAKEKSKCRSPIGSGSPKYWGPFHLPGNKMGDIGPKECSLIYKRTGWIVRTRYRGGNWKGNNWGCRMMSGYMKDDGTECNYHKSWKMAHDTILRQQQTRIYPSLGAIHVPYQAHLSQRLPLLIG